MGRTFVVFFVLSSTFATGQERLFPKAGALLFKIVPGSMTNPEFSTLDFAISHFLSDKYAVEIKYGQKISLNEQSETKFDGHKIFIDLQRPVCQRIAVAIEFGYARNREVETLNYYNALEEEVIDKFYTLKQRYSVAPKMIAIFHRGKHFLFEGFGGIGIKRVQGSVTDLEFDESNGDRDYHEYEGLFVAGPKYHPYRRTDVRVSLGLNLCYVINSTRH
ncbi:MAG TPA: hypothetical protein VGD65_06440 [Chryseosolibacter sp.]